ncbi:MAG: hypothetical protein AAFV53_15465 [Myxococcota bacterium]
MTEAELREYLNSYRWVGVPRYRDDPSLSWEARYRRLDAHHVQETEFLIAEVRRLAQRLFDVER